MPGNKGTVDVLIELLKTAAVAQSGDNFTEDSVGKIAARVAVECEDMVAIAEMDSLYVFQALFAQHIVGFFLRPEQRIDTAGIDLL